MTTLEIIMTPFALLGALAAVFAIWMFILDGIELREDREEERRAERRAANED